MVSKIRVKNSSLIKLPSFDDFPDGNLVIGESLKDIPFKIKRFYFINNLFNKKAVRGKHAHKETEQIIFCLNGKFTLDLNDGTHKQTIMMSDPNKGVLLGKMLWHTMKSFSSDCIILVVANDYYKKEDYVRNYEEFLQLIKKGKKK